jgi:CxxC-x17-CxxC domain-containing protein
MRAFNRSSNSGRFGGRDNRRPSFGSRGRDFSARKEMHAAVCNECGKNCQVPFKPTGNKEIFCSDCFQKRGGKEGMADSRMSDRNVNRYESNDRESSYGSRDRFSSNDREMFSATCDECGKDCKLPFKPSSNKPVYCSQCFEYRGEKAGLHDAPEYNRSKRVDSGEGMSGASRKELGEIRDQVVSINVKLEKIMKALNIKSVKPVTETVAVETADVIMDELQTILDESDEQMEEAVEVVAEVKAPAKKKIAVKKAAVKKVAVKKVPTKKAAKK